MLWPGFKIVCRGHFQCAGHVVRRPADKHSNTTRWRLFGPYFFSVFHSLTISHFLAISHSFSVSIPLSRAISGSHRSRRKPFRKH